MVAEVSSRSIGLSNRGFCAPRDGKPNRWCARPPPHTRKMVRPFTFFGRTLQRAAI